MAFQVIHLQKKILVKILNYIQLHFIADERFQYIFCSVLINYCFKNLLVKHFIMQEQLVLNRA